MKQLVLSLILALVAVVSCNKPKPVDPSPKPGPNDKYYVERFNYRTIHSADANDNSSDISNDFGDMPIISGGDADITHLRADAISYNTVDPRGNKVIASGLVTYPRDVPPKGVVVVQHPTIMSNSQAPTNDMSSIEGSYAFNGYVVIQTDYLGYGKTKNLPHPYLHYESTALQGVHMLLAAREYMALIDKPISDLDLYGVGYSQGGAAIVAFQKMAESEYSDQIDIKHVYAGAGPYDLQSTYDFMIENPISGIPSAAPLIMMGLDYGEALNLDYSKLFKKPLLSHYKEWYGSKKYTSAMLNNKLGSSNIKNFMHEDMFNDRGNSEIDKVKGVLKKNSLIEGWIPKGKITLFHSTEDTYVPVLNTEILYKSLHAKAPGKVDKQIFPMGDHIPAAVLFYMEVMAILP